MGEHDLPNMHSFNEVRKVNTLRLMLLLEALQLLVC
jgi:hypothetical protein